VIEMELVGVRVEMPSSTPIVVLRERSGERRVLPIFIGAPEATAIAFALEEVVTPRPMTHDLLRNLLDDLGVSLEKVLITALDGGVFYADLELHAHDGVHTLTSRPSDAIALAARSGAPIFVAEAILAEAGYLEEPEDATEGEGESEEVVEQFRDFIDSVNPEDFAS
jgi:bifunctional DNase/RNase